EDCLPWTSKSSILSSCQASRISGACQTIYTVTTKRVLTSRGIFTKSTQEVLMKDICSINVYQGVVERMLGIGAIKIGSAASEDKDIQFFGVPDARTVKDLISRYRK
ncbi:PH domain-containing protein, partial [Marinobacter bryozoorum]|uniref:PH domain-containing protein n=1 Tax=Marinobacter bryozoorum TaxID=256324 RepID=UPI002003B1FD